jgi:hypothetical protein
MKATSTLPDASSAPRAVDPDWEKEPLFQLPIEAKMRMMPDGPEEMPPRPGLTAQPPTMPPDASREAPPPSQSDPPDILDELARVFMKATPGLSYETAYELAQIS